MTDGLRRLRGALGIAATWAASWAALAVVLGIVVGLLRPEEIDPGEGPAKVAAVFGLAGFLSGLGFAGLFTTGETRRAVYELSLGRAALWGFLGAAPIPALMGADMGEGWITGALGAVFAAISVAGARRAGPPATHHAASVK